MLCWAEVASRQTPGPRKPWGGTEKTVLLLSKVAADYKILWDSSLGIT